MKIFIVTLVCPFFGDQFFWGQRVHRLGVGPEPIPQKELTADRLAGAIRTAVDDADVSTRADRLLRRIGSEQGIVIAARMIEGLVA